MDQLKFHLHFIILLPVVSCLNFFTFKKKVLNVCIYQLPKILLVGFKFQFQCRSGKIDSLILLSLFLEFAIQC